MQAIASQRTSLTRYVDGVLRPALVHGGTVVVGRANTNVLLRSLQYEPDIVTVKVWRPDGVLAWTNRERGRIGHKFELDDELEEALDENQTVGTISPANAWRPSFVPTESQLWRVLRSFLLILDPVSLEKRA